MKPLIVLSFLLTAALLASAAAQQTSETNAKLKEALKKYPEADADKDGVLTLEEGRAFMAAQRATRGARKPAPQNTTIFEPGSEDLKAAIEGGRAPNGENTRQPLQYEKGNGLRIVMTGHSWVAPGRKTLPGIAAAAGYDGHQQRSHTSGGGTGSANAIWLKEFGKYDKNPPKNVLLPAIATGQWDVMTWGSYYEDKPAYYTQWIDLCLNYNPDTVFCIQDGWPRFQPDFKDKTPQDILAAIDARQAELQDSMYQRRYDSLEKEYPGKVRIIPASYAVVDLIHRYYAGEAPHLDCVDEKTDGGTKGIYSDGGHLSRTSGTEHLVGYLYYGMLYKKSPALIEGYAPADIPAPFDKLMREIAWKAIVESPFTGVDDADGDGVAD